MNRIDIHNYPARLQHALRRVEESDLSRENKDVILAFANYLQVKGLTSARAEKYVITLRMIALTLKKDFRNATREDLENYILQFRARQDRSVWTKTDYAVTLHRFYRWLEGDDQDTPPKVARISASLKKKDQPRIKKAELLTEQDVQALLRAARTPRDRALLAVTWDTGARIGEIGGLHIADLKFSNQETTLDLQGKTGQRTVLAIECTPHLLNWLQNHPRSDDPQAPLWINIGQEQKRRGEALTYSAILAMFQRTFERAGLKKRYNPHLFRHSRATWCVEHGWSTYELCRQFGWELDSGMPAVYLSLSDGFVQNKMRESYGLAPAAQAPLVRLATCARCQARNAPDATLCVRCGFSLQERPRYSEFARDEQTDERLHLALRDPRVSSVLRRVLAEHLSEVEPERDHPGSVLRPLPPIPETASSIPEDALSGSVPDLEPALPVRRLVSSRVLRGKATSPRMKEVA